MLVVFWPIFVANTKIIVDYSFGAPLKSTAFASRKLLILVAGRNYVLNPLSYWLFLTDLFDLTFRKNVILPTVES